jgi:hypothetical protein
MRLQVLFVRNFAATRPELNRVQRVQRQPRKICQAFGKCRFSAAGVAEYCDAFHLARPVNMSRDAARALRSLVQPSGHSVEMLRPAAKGLRGCERQ